MNPISDFFVQNIIAVYFFYGLAFFVMGLALILVNRQTSTFRFAGAIPYLAAFGILHGIHEWFEMFQKIAALSGARTPAIPEEIGRLILLGLSFLMLLIFGVSLLRFDHNGPLRRYWPVAGLVGFWLLSLALVSRIYAPSPKELIPLADVLLRYLVGIPGALIGAWALMTQQRTFREHNMPQFGRDLVWCAAALLLYGVIGQIFVPTSLLPPSNIINSPQFLHWFGIPVQLFRGVMAAFLAFFMTRALRAFDLEGRRRLEQANQAKLQAQTAALAVERRISREMEQLNEELRLSTHELSVLLELSNLLAQPMNLPDKLRQVLEKVVRSLEFSDAGMILLVEQKSEQVSVPVVMGFTAVNGVNQKQWRSSYALELGRQCIDKGIAMCRHVDGTLIEFSLEDALVTLRCQKYQSPTIMVALPLPAQHQIIGSLVLARPKEEERHLTFDEFKLMVGIAQQMGLSIENVRLYEEAQKREKMLGDLLQQAVGAQESERQRIARELHDATGQSLTAIALGLRGLETVVTSNAPVEIEQIKELKIFSTVALGELRQIIADLRPPQLDDLGLVAALQWYVNAFEKRRSILVEFVVEGERVRLPSECETVLFRITQEALTNVAKHAQASNVALHLKMSPTQICLKVDDDGLGFEPSAILDSGDKRAGWGLLGIRERVLLLGGQYKIKSAPGNGTHIRVWVPLTGERNNVQNTATAG